MTAKIGRLGFFIGALFFVSMLSIGANAETYAIGGSYTDTDGNFTLSLSGYEGMTIYIYEYKNGSYQGQVSTSITNRPEGSYEYQFIWDLPSDIPECAITTCYPITLGSTFVVVDVPASTASASFSPSSISEGGSATFSWSSSNATNCSASGISGVSGTSGSVTYNAPSNMSSNQTVNVNLTCSGGGGSDSDSASLSINYVNDAPTISSISNRTINEDSSTGAISFTVGDEETSAGSLSLSRSSSNTSLIPTGNITFGGSGATRTVNVTPAANQSGTATVTVTVSDGGATASRTFAVTVNPINDAPTISSISNQTINEDSSTGAIAFTIGDLETAAGSLSLSRFSTNTALIPIGNIVFGGSGANRTVTVTPTANQSGSATITAIVLDGSAIASRSFVVTVNAVNDTPTISSISNHTVDAGNSTGAISFTVGDIETSAGSLTLSRSSSNTALIPTGNIVFGGSGASRTVTVTPAPNMNGSATITATVSDGLATASRSFVVNVVWPTDAPASYVTPTIISADTPGSMPYTAGVSDDGLANISVPVKLPPGVNGLKPSLSVNFNSGFKALSQERHLGHSLLGDGWYIGGLSSIHRCQQQVAGAPALSLSNSDRLCLDGMPLVLVSGTYWSSGSVYHTENETFTKVTLLSNNGVYSFDVRTADGRILTYGGTGSAVVEANGVEYEWALVTEADRFGNSVNYEYYNLARNEYFPKQIEYDGTVVSFDYEQRPTNSIPSYSLAGYTVSRTVNLSRINVSAMGVASRSYQLGSVNVGNSVRLDKIQECGFEQGVNVSCMAPLSFNWYDSGGRAAVDYVVDGLGAETLFEYGTSLLTESSFPDFRDLTATSCGLTTQSSDRLYTRTLSKSNGRGGYNSWTYKAQSAPRYSTEGRGYVGHANVMVSDSQKGVRSYIHHWQCFPYTQQVAAAYSYTGAWSSSQALAKEEVRWASQALNSGTTQFVYAQKSTSLGYEGGVQFGFNETNTAFTFSGSLPTSTVSTTTAADRANLSGNNWVPVNVQKRITTSSSHANDSGNWLIGFVNQVDVQHKDVPGESNSPILTTTLTQIPGTLAVDTTNRFPSTDLNVVTDFDYLSNGNLSSITVSGSDFDTRQMSFSGYIDDRYPGQITNAMGHVENAVYDRRFGILSQFINTSSQTTTNAFDPFGRRIYIDPPTPRIIEISYLDCTSGCPSAIGPHIPVYRKEVQDLAAPNTITYYDELNRVIRTEVAAFSAADGYSTVDVEYDSVGRVVKKSLPYFSSGTPRYVQYAYDTLDRIETETRPDGSSTTNTYSLNSTSSPTRFRVETTDTVVTPGFSTETQTARSEFNSLGQLIEKIDALGSSEQVATTYDYDVYGNLDFTQVNGNSATNTTMVYDRGGNRLSITEPNTGTTTSDYDGLGQLLLQTDARGVTTQYSYNLIGQITQRIDGGVNGAPAVTNTWGYDPVSGLLVGRSNDAATPSYESFIYSNGKLESYTFSTITESFQTRGLSKWFQYDGYGRPGVVGYQAYGILPNNSIEIKYEYNTQGYLTALRNDWTNELLQEIQAKDAFNNVTETQFGNGVTTSNTYDSNSGRLTGTTTSNGIQSNTYNWRSNGILKSRSKGTLSETFSYDGLNRLTQATSVIPGTDRSLNYDYDLLGNLNFKTSNMSGDTDVTGYAYGGTANAGPHAVSQVTINGVTNNLAYDPVGNVTSISSSAKTRDFTYSNFNKVTQIEQFTGSTNPDVVEQFLYGPNLSRYYKSSTYVQNGQQVTDRSYYVLGGEMELMEPESETSIEYIAKYQLSPSVQWVKTYYGGTNIVDSVNYLHRDHLGSVEAISDQNGNVQSSRAHDPFGGRREADWSAVISQSAFDAILNGSTSLTNRGFTGHEHLDRTGIIHMNGRIYDPEIGRFLNADPIVSAPGYSQSYNRYAYVFNSPLSFTDPSGYEGVESQVIPQWWSDLPCFTYACQNVSGESLFGLRESNGPSSAAIAAGISTNGGSVISCGALEIPDLNCVDSPRPERTFWQKAGSLSGEFLSGLWREMEAIPMEGQVVGGIKLATSAKFGAVLLGFGRRLNTPAWKTVIIEMEEVTSGHMLGGWRLVPGNKKDLFPDTMTVDQVEKAIRLAFRDSTIFGAPQGDRLFLVGPFGKGTIEMWYNKVTKTIETAWPKY